jgi:hypothetical protein
MAATMLNVSTMPASRPISTLGRAEHIHLVRICTSTESDQVCRCSHNGLRGPSKVRTIVRLSAESRLARTAIGEPTYGRQEWPAGAANRLLTWL